MLHWGFWGRFSLGGRHAWSTGDVHEWRHGVVGSCRVWGKRADSSLGAFVLGCLAGLFLPLPSSRLFLQEVLLTTFPKHSLPFAFLSLGRCSLTGYRELICFTISPAASSQSWLLLAEGSGFEHAAPCLSILLPQPHYDIVDIPLERASLPTPSLFY